MIPSFKTKLAAGDTVIVVNPDHPSSSLVEFIGRLGVDAVMIDTEQGSPDVESVEEMARAARVAGLCALVRIYSPEANIIERYMFRGIHGIIVPRVDSGAQARKVVEDVRYCFPNNFQEKVVIVQIESAAAVRDIDAFLAVPEIDCFFIGVVDLSKSLGFKGDYRAPEVVRQIDGTIEKILAAGRRVGIMVKEDDLAAWRRKGVQFLYTHLNDFAVMGADRFQKLLAAAD